MTQGLVRYEAARAALAAAHRVDEVKTIRDKAQAMAAYAKQARDTQMVQWATEIKVRAERRCGEMLRDSAETGQRATKTSGPPRDVSHDATHTATLRDLGITRDQSSRYQKLAAMPAEHFETAVETAKATAGAVTSAHMLRLADELRQTQEVRAMLKQTPAQKAANAWRPICDALSVLHKRTRDAGRLPVMPITVYDDLASTWPAVANFFLARIDDATTLHKQRPPAAVAGEPAVQGRVYLTLDDPRRVAVLISLGCSPAWLRLLRSEIDRVIKLQEAAMAAVAAKNSGAAEPVL